MRPWTTARALVAALATALAGCSLLQAPRSHRGTAESGLEGGERIAPKRCAVTVSVLSRPLKDEVLNQVAWRLADEQAVGADARHALEANGLRIGVVTGDLPPKVVALLNAPPPHKIDPKTVILPDGDTLLVPLGAPTPSTSLLLSRDGHATGKTYEEARGAFRLTASHEGDTGVSLRIVPEVHHGPIRRRVGADPAAGAFAPQQFLFKEGQEEETFRELAATLSLKPGQVALIASLPDRRGSLGDFMLTEPEAGSDRLTQKVVLVWAARNTEPPGTPRGSPPPPGLVPVDPAAPADVTTK